MTALRARRCQVCNAGLTYRFAALTHGGKAVQHLYQCPGCHHWQHTTVTDPSEAARLITSLTNGNPT